MAPGISDESVLAMANREASLLVTADKDFGELVFRQGRFTRGTLLLRLAGVALERKAALVASVIAQRSEELPDAFAVLTPRSLRIRRLE